MCTACVFRRYWGRDSEGTPTGEEPKQLDKGTAGQFPEAFTTQPIMMDEYFRTWQQVQARVN